MSRRTPGLPGSTHSGGSQRRRAAGRHPRVAHDLTGVVRWLDREEGLIVVQVEEASRHAAVFVGCAVTVDVSRSRRRTPRTVTGVDELLPGTVVRVRAWLPRDLGASCPDLVEATSVAAFD